MDSKTMALLFKALSDESRIHILNILKVGECCACELLERLSISQSTLSHHMKTLTDCGLVCGRKDGKWCHYSINQDQLTAVIALLNELKSK